jgi:hypothetical protein
LNSLRELSLKLMLCDVLLRRTQAQFKTAASSSHWWQHFLVEVAPNRKAPRAGNSFGSSRHVESDDVAFVYVEVYLRSGQALEHFYAGQVLMTARLGKAMCTKFDETRLPVHIAESEGQEDILWNQLATNCFQHNVHSSYIARYCG